MSRWLFATAGLTFGMIVLGGLTRLTRSGLSMTNWKPLGRLPPLNEREWLAEFEEYKKYPEFQKKNMYMTLDEFKFIFYMEWTHRTYGRALGLVYALPMTYFLLSGRARRVSPKMPFQLLGLLGLGASQGLIGWWMVRSGLDEALLIDPLNREPRVSPYRLAVHLVMATSLYSGLIWTGMTASPHPPRAPVPAAMPPGFAPRFRALGAVLLTTLVSGVFVAGNDAGRAYNDWPLFNGRLVPAEIWDERKGWRNFMENTATVQFDHRMLAYTALGSSLAMGFAYRPHYRPMVGIAHAALLQAGIGIAALVTLVPTWLGVAHQAGALTVWSCYLWLAHRLLRRK